ncbi:helix-turn-helix domain-containing protein [Phreatobacter sp. HK31-P]
MDIQTLRSPSGDEMVVIPRAEYDALVARIADLDEDEADVAVYDARKAELAAGEAEALPERVTQHLRYGHSLLRSVRLWREVRQVDLAKQARVSQGFVSDIENGKKAGDPDTMARIAAVLDVPARWFTKG